MAERHNLLRPYKFTWRVVYIMIATTLLATLISFAFSYQANETDYHNEIISAQSMTAVYLLELNQKTTLPVENMVRMVSTDTFNLTVLENPLSPLTLEQASTLARKKVLTLFDPVRDMPMTYVDLGDSLVCIAVNPHVNTFSTTLLRFILTGSIFVSIFLLMSLLASRVIASPITMLTRATRKVADGDFSVRLPDKGNGEVGELMRSFNSMADTLGKTAYLQKDFISSVSHEFRTPIASIKGYATLLQMPGLDDESRQEYVNMIAHESDRLSNLSKTLLRLASLEQQMTPATLSTFRLDEQVRQVILRLAPIWDARGFDWQLNLQEVTITSDEELLNQVWVNLIQNALKFSDDNSTITIDITTENNTAVVSIADQGIGMDQAIIDRIFDRFYQADKSRTKEGAGLGLSLVKRIVDILGGHVSAHSVKGEGSTFTVCIPYSINNRKTGG